MGMDVFSIGLSGINAGVRRIEVSADNTARANLPNQAKNRVINSDRKDGGVNTTVQKVPLEATAPGDEGFLTTNIDYAEEAVSQAIGKTLTQAELRVLEAENKTQGYLLDIKI